MIPILTVKDNNGNIIEIPAIKGDKGTDGYTPIKGVDYFTESDKVEFVELVLEALPAAEGVGF